MTIIFKTRDGRIVETTDKNVLIAAAKKGEIGPDTVVTIDGAGINAGRIKELVFGDPPPAAPVNPPETKEQPPKVESSVKLSGKIASALDGLRAVGYIVSTLVIVASLPMVGIGFESENAITLITGVSVAVIGITQFVVTGWILDIVEYFAKK